MTSNITAMETEDIIDPVVDSTRSVRVKLRAAPSVVKHYNVEQIIDTPSVAVPAGLGRSGLTSVVNHFLTSEFSLDESKTTFEFYDVERETLVKGTLDRHLTKFKLTEEDTLVLEYAFPKVTKFTEDGPGAPIPDWISCLAIAADGVVFAGSFDGSLVTSRLANKKGLEVVSIEASAHSAQVTSVSAFKLRGSTFVASASKDASVAIRRLDSDALSGRIATCTSGANRSLETVCSALSSDDPDDVLLASGGWGGDIYFFQANVDSSATKGTKRQKDDPTGLVVTPSCTLRGHTDNVSSCVWSAEVDPVTLYSGSWDHTLRVWDCVRQVETASLHAQKPFTSIDFLSSKQVLASGHPDHVVRMWDARASGDAVVKLQMKGHRGWVSCVKFEGEESNLLATASYDRTVRVWDIRGGVPVQTIQTDVTGKLFSVVWGAEHLFLGGSDAVIRTYKAEK